MIEQSVVIAPAVNELTRKIQTLEESLHMLVQDKCDYMRINQLGDPEEEYIIRFARAALAGEKSND